MLTPRRWRRDGGPAGENSPPPLPPTPRHRSTTGHTTEQSFFFDQLSGRLKGLCIVDAHNVVYVVEVHRGGQEVFTDALQEVGVWLGQLACVEIVVVQRAHWIDGDDFDVGVLLFEVLADPRECSAGARTRDEYIDFAIQLFVQLGSG